MVRLEKTFMGRRCGSLSLGRPQAKHVARVRDIVLDSLRGYRVQVYLFGSAAKGLAGTGSDIDVAVLPLEPLPTGLLSLVRERLEESTVPYKVDLVDLGRADAAFRKRVQQEGLLWNE